MRAAHNPETWPQIKAGTQKWRNAFADSQVGAIQGIGERTRPGTGTGHRGHLETGHGGHVRHIKDEKHFPKEPMHTLTQAPKGNEYGVCGEVCIGSRPRKPVVHHWKHSPSVCDVLSPLCPPCPVPVPPRVFRPAPSPVGGSRPTSNQMVRQPDRTCVPRGRGTPHARARALPIPTASLRLRNHELGKRDEAVLRGLGAGVALGAVAFVAWRAYRYQDR